MVMMVMVMMGMVVIIMTIMAHVLHGTIRGESLRDGHAGAMARVKVASVFLVTRNSFGG